MRRWADTSIPPQVIRLTSPSEVLKDIKILTLGKAPCPNYSEQGYETSTIARDKFLTKVLNSVLSGQYFPPAWSSHWSRERIPRCSLPVNPQVNLTLLVNFSRRSHLQGFSGNKWAPVAAPREVLVSSQRWHNAASDLQFWKCQRKL
jgi:hypothetical protein